MAATTMRLSGPYVPLSTALFLLLYPVPVVCFVGAVLTDTAYLQGALLMWLHFSQWLIAAGLAVGLLAALLLVVDIATHGRGTERPSAWAHPLLFLAALLIELFNAFVHTADGWTAVAPTGMVLSVVGALLALASVAALFRSPRPRVAPQEVRA